VANRRERGLALLAEAARLHPDAGMRGRLRDEAIAFLALRDLEKRPDLPTGRAVGMAFAGADRLAIVAEDGESFALWSMSGGGPLGPAHPSGPSLEPREGRTRDRGDPRRFGRRIAVAGAFGAVVWPDGRGVRLFDPASGAPGRDLPLPGRDIQTLMAIEAPSGPRLVTIDRPVAPEEDGPPLPPEPRDREPFTLRVTLWDPDRTERPIAELTAPRPENARVHFPMVAHSTDDDTIAVAWFRGTTVTLWSAEDGRSRGEIDTSSPLGSLAMGPYGQLAAAGVGAVRLWDTTTRLPLSMLTPHQANPIMLRFSPDGRLLAVVGFGSADVELWDPAANVQIAALTTTDPASELAFAPDGSRIVAAQASSIAVWAIVDSSVRQRASGLEATPWSLAFAPDGCLAVAFGGAAPARLWHPDRCPTTARTSGEANPLAASFDSRGRLILAMSDSLIVKEDRDRSGQPLRVVLPESVRSDDPRDRPPPAWPRTQAIARSGDGRHLALLRSNEVLLWNAAAPEEFRVVSLARDRDTGETSGPPERRKSARKGEGGGRPGGRGRGGRTPWGAAAIDPSASFLYALTWAGDLHAWRLDGSTAHPLAWASAATDRGRSVPMGTDPQPPAFTALALSPDGTTLALGRRDGGIILVDARTGTGRRELAPPSSVEGETTVTSLTFAPNDQAMLAAGSSSGIVRLHRLRPPSEGPIEPPLSLPPHAGTVRALAFDDTGRHLASAGEDKSVEVWALDELGRALTRLDLPW
jgi:WD40 repeat protein